MIERFLEGQVFGPVAVLAMTEAYTAACRELGIHPHDGNTTAELLAKAIIELCKAGETNPTELTVLATAAVRVR